jgi:signal transduction histidine kinase
LNHEESALELVVADDGVGFDVERTLKQAASRGGLGLLGMRERVERIGGILDVHSVLRQGTRIRATFPTTESVTEPGHA